MQHRGQPRPSRPRRRVRSAAGLLTVAVLVAAGCGSDDEAQADRDRPAAAKAGEITEPTADGDLAADLGDSASALMDAGCSFGTYAEEEAIHVEPDDGIRSATFPPTTGEHFADWAPFGRYDEPIEDGYVVHNLEHGGVVAWIGEEVDQETSDAIGALLDSGEKWIVAPREDIDGLFSAAWSKGLSCPPEALEQLGPDGTAEALDAWFEAVVSTGSEAEKDVPAYAGAMKEPTPVDDISQESPF